MLYSKNGDTIKLEMSESDYETLLMMLGAAVGRQESGEPLFWHWLDFVNRLNAGNPQFTPCEIPEQFKTHADRSAI